jgi:hypothetical protein
VRVWGVGLLVVLVLACAGSAQAATRFAKPAGGSAGPCATAETGCSLEFAVEGAESGDEVIVEPGAYELSDRLDVKAGISVHGEFASPMPVVTGTTTSASLRASGLGASIQWLEGRHFAEGGSAIACGRLATVERVRAIATGRRAVGISTSGYCDVVDSLAVGHGTDAYGINVQSDGSSVEPTIRNSTAVASGNGSIGIRVAVPEGDPGHIYPEIVNTIAAGDFLGLYGEGSEVEIFARHDDVTSISLEDSAKFEDHGGNLTAPPLFVDPASENYAEATGSPTIDAGAILPDFATPTLDLAGNPRVVNGTLDIGAYEYVPPVPQPPGNAGGSSGSNGTNSPPPPPPPVSIGGLKLTPSAFHVTAKGRGKAKGKGPVGTKIAFNLSAASQVTFTVARKTTGRKAGKGCVKATKGNAKKPKCPLYAPVSGNFGAAGATGANTVGFAGVLGGKALAPGSYRLTATAGASTATANFTVLG